MLFLLHAPSPHSPLTPTGPPSAPAAVRPHLLPTSVLPHSIASPTPPLPFCTAQDPRLRLRLLQSLLASFLSTLQGAGGCGGATGTARAGRGTGPRPLKDAGTPLGGGGVETLGPPCPITFHSIPHPPAPHSHRTGPPAAPAPPIIPPVLLPARLAQGYHRHGQGAGGRGGAASATRAGSFSFIPNSPSPFPHPPTPLFPPQDPRLRLRLLQSLLTSFLPASPKDPIDMGRVRTVAVLRPPAPIISSLIHSPTSHSHRTGPPAAPAPPAVPPDLLPAGRAQGSHRHGQGAGSGGGAARAARAGPGTGLGGRGE
ncbi:unnamed protein product [Closterium sp. NIES-54]